MRLRQAGGGFAGVRAEAAGGEDIEAKLTQARQPWHCPELYDMAVKAALDGARALAAHDNGALTTVSSPALFGIVIGIACSGLPQVVLCMGACSALSGQSPGFGSQLHMRMQRRFLPVVPNNSQLRMQSHGLGCVCPHLMMRLRSCVLDHEGSACLWQVARMFVRVDVVLAVHWDSAGEEMYVTPLINEMDWFNSAAQVHAHPLVPAERMQSTHVMHAGPS